MKMINYTNLNRNNYKINVHILTLIFLSNYNLT